MSRTVDYYFATQSPWAFLGHDRFVQLLRAGRREVNVLPVDFGRVFPVSGGLPLPKRAPQRQAYRLVELRRFADHLGVAMNIQPKHFPVDGTPSSLLITAVAQHDGMSAALRLAGAVLAACWREERDIANEGTLAELLDETDLPAERLGQSRQADTQARYAAHTQAAIDAGVFGAPTYVIDGEPFWGQDRLDFVARKLGVF
ncbi:2-hydroxychromene-2-carboxylate isomerase [Ottowia sp.]|uniref:2-hydroxychromene-2-carboxylate isomerase n=1 Tax=Ottowia sp. TaxID=1898956 RepID=UPI002C59D132|nr:2-hydroxychromene-2-carboxylate isomerase [Ottowia sp.]HOB68000.1 2-hydroxychromene-2-carboxylate isomerase [Ottowia sp.]HPZ58582.1 2-hydroxychromene-2-carboxylate isomerase [Ottowia sp.]HQD49313.1 2-hydroxychromene-2-carboxylate isomerase [Ottowia sp.]